MMARIVNRLGELKEQKEQREKRTISWNEIANTTGIAYTTLLRWKNNNVDRFDEPMLVKLCEYFGVQPGDILKYVE